ncbi:MAG: transporter [Bdellovibrionales bacterium]|nr:transporter [Bdellovibrionales bacterium]
MNLLLLFCALLFPLVAEAGRGFASDRPGVTDDPHTQADSEYRVEIGAYTLNIERKAGETVRTETFASTALVRGVGSRSEVQIGFDGLSTITTKSESDDTRINKSGGFQLRYKYNLLGNEDGDVAVAVIPIVAHTGEIGDNLWAGGFNVPVTVVLSAHWTLWVMPGWFGVDTAPGLNSTYFVGAALGYEFSESFGAFVQSRTTLDDYSYSHSMQGAGIVYMLTPGTQLDLSLDYSKNGNHEDFRIVSGLTLEF